MMDMLRINRELQITLLYVTNDYEEAMQYGDRTVLMKSGSITEIINHKKMSE